MHESLFITDVLVRFTKNLYEVVAQPHTRSLQASDSKPPKYLIKETHHVCLDQSTSSTNQNKAISEQNKMALTTDASSTAKFFMKETLPLHHQWINKEFPVIKETSGNFHYYKTTYM